MDEKEIRFIDLFGGVGGFRLGLERANNNRTIQKAQAKNLQRDMSNCSTSVWNGGESNTFSCVAYYEIDKYAVQTYNKNFKESHEPVDIRTLKVSEIPDFDMLCAGFPCQAFSIAGKRKGFDDTRGTLFFEIARIARTKKPRYLLLENVKGLLSHDNGKTFGKILATLDELGYDVEWQVLNSKHFGVPQNRERVFIVGHLTGESSRKVFPITESSKKSDKRYAKEQVASALQSPGHACGNYRGMTMIHNIYGGFGEKKPREFTEHLPMVLDDYNKRIKENGIVPAVRQTNANKSLGNASKIIENQRIRRLTPTECERLQGFPDNWTAGVSDTQRYKQMGNAVTVNVVEAIAKAFFEANK